MIHSLKLHLLYISLFCILGTLFYVLNSIKLIEVVSASSFNLEMSSSINSTTQSYFDLQEQYCLLIEI